MADVAHRVAFELVNGFAPECVMHACDNPPCVNPAHLLPGTRADNNRDMKAKGRHAADTGTQNSPAGMRHGCAKLTDSDVFAIRASQNTSQRELAKRYGVSQRTITKVLNRIGWKHL